MKKFLNNFYPNFQLNIDTIFNDYLDAIKNMADDKIKEKIKKDIDNVNKELIEDYKIFIVISIITKEKSLSISKKLLEIRKDFIRECADILELDVSKTEKIIEFGDNSDDYINKWNLELSVKFMQEVNP